MDDNDTLYGRWIAGELTDQEFKELEASGQLEELKRIVDTVDQWQTPDYNVDDAFKRLQSNLNESRDSSSKVRSISRGWVLGIAASVLLLAVFVYLLRPESTTTVSASHTHTQLVQLNDGTSVELNDGSSLSFKEGPGEVRRVELKGEAFFKVTKGTEFRVFTDEGDVTVLGTEFNVRTWDNNLEVTCYEGSVRVTRGDALIVLNAGDDLTFVNGDRPLSSRISEEGPSWLVGVSRFRDAQLSIVLKELERQYDCRVEFKSTGQKYSGQFEHDDLTSAVRNICLPLGLEFDISPDLKLVTISTPN